MASEWRVAARGPDPENQGGLPPCLAGAIGARSVSSRLGRGCERPVADLACRVRLDWKA